MKDILRAEEKWLQIPIHEGELLQDVPIYLEYKRQGWHVTNIEGEVNLEGQTYINVCFRRHSSSGNIEC